MVQYQLPFIDSSQYQAERWYTAMSFVPTPAGFYIQNL